MGAGGQQALIISTIVDVLFILTFEKQALIISTIVDDLAIITQRYVGQQALIISTIVDIRCYSSSSLEASKL